MPFSNVQPNVLHGVIQQWPKCWTIEEIFSWRSSVLGWGFRKRSMAERKLHSVCRKWTAVQQDDESTAKGFVPTEFDCTPSINAQRVAKAILLNFEAGLFRTAA